MREYLKIRALSLGRLFRDFPFIMQLVIAGLVIFVAYVLLSLQLEITFRSFTGLAIIQLLLSFLVITPSPKEEILLLTLKIPLRQVKAIKILLLAIPFLLINPLIALGATCCSLLFLLDNSRKTRISFKHIVIPTPFCKSSYRWVSTFRKGGICLIAIVLFLQIMSVVHLNPNLAKVSVFLLTCLPAFFTVFGVTDPKDFLYCFKNARWLIFTKLKENLLNTAFLVLLSLPITLFYLLRGEYSFVLVLSGSIFLNLIMELTYYMLYPSAFIALIVFGLLFISLITIIVQLPLWTSILIMLILFCIAYFIAYSNIKSLLYEHH